MAGPLRAGGGKGPGQLGKNNFFVTIFQRSKISTPIKLEGGGLGLNGPAIKRRTFFSASLTERCEGEKHMYIYNFYSVILVLDSNLMGGGAPFDMKLRIINVYN